MDNFVKIVNGWVQQYYEPNKDGIFVCTSQEFIAGDNVYCENDGGNVIDQPNHKYQPYGMQQPESAQQEKLLDVAKEIVRDFNRCGEVLQAGDNGEYGTESAIGRLDAIVNQIEEG